MIKPQVFGRIVLAQKLLQEDEGRAAECTINDVFTYSDTSAHLRSLFIHFSPDNWSSL
jgi:hypothetical protein